MASAKKEDTTKVEIREETSFDSARSKGCGPLNEARWRDL